MKNSLRIAVACAAICMTSPARAAVGYYDLQRAISDTQAGKKAVSNADAAESKIAGDYQRAMAEAAKLKGQGRADAEERARVVAAQAKQQESADLTAFWQDYSARANRVLPKIGQARHLEATVPAGWSIPKLDITAELTKRLDAGEGATEEQTEVALREKASAAEARAAAAEAKLRELQAKQQAAPPAPAVVKKFP